MNKLCSQKIELTLKNSNKDWFDDLSAEEKAEIEKGLKEANNEQLLSHKEAMSQFDKWH